MASGRISTRSLLRAFQQLHKSGVDPGLLADMELLRHKDLDLSVKFGGLLAFNALLMNAALQPISASPGAPLSLDAAAQPVITVATTAAAGILLLSCYFCLRGLIAGEEFDPNGVSNDPAALSQRIFAAFCHSIDLETRALLMAIRTTIVGGVATGASLAFILWDKINA